MMNVIDLMNYQYNNPGSNLKVAGKLVDLATKRGKLENIEQFAMWASMSSENLDYNKIITLLNSNKEIEQSKQKAA